MSLVVSINQLIFASAPPDLANAIKVNVGEDISSYSKEVKHLHKFAPRNSFYNRDNWIHNTRGRYSHGSSVWRVTSQPHTTSTTMATTKAPCLSHQFQCSSDRRCIQLTRVCDSHKDCYDGSDEWGCSKTPVPKALEGRMSQDSVTDFQRRAGHLYASGGTLNCKCTCDPL